MLKNKYKETGEIAHKFKEILKKIGKILKQFLKNT